MSSILQQLVMMLTLAGDGRILPGYNLEFSYLVYDRMLCEIMGIAIGIVWIEASSMLQVCGATSSVRLERLPGVNGSQGFTDLKGAIREFARHDPPSRRCLVPQSVEMELICCSFFPG